MQALFPPSVMIGLAVLATLYALAARLGSRRVAPRQALAFAGALLTIWISLGPLDALADRRFFTIHMLEHSLLTLVMPPLLLLGMPEWMLRPWLLSRPLAPLARLLTNPVIAFALANIVLAVAHVGPVFDRMVRDEPFHVFIHLSFMATATLMWWPLLSPLPEMPRLPYPAQIFYLFIMMIPMAAIAAPITLAPRVLYPWYLEGPHPAGISPLSDQVLGGVLMWVGDGIYIMCVFTLIFYRWSQRDDRDRPLVRASSAELKVLSPWAHRGA